MVGAGSLAKIYMSHPSVLCSLGRDIEEVWQSILKGDTTSIVRERIGPKDFYVARIKDEWLSPTGDSYDMRLLRVEEKGLEALFPWVNLAIEHYGRERIGICIGSCDNGAELSYKAHESYFKGGSFPKGYSLTAQSAQYPCEYAKRKYGIGGAALGFATACSSSGSSIVAAADLLRLKVYDALIVGGVDIVSMTAILGFDSLGAIAPSPCIPFSANRLGITLGEAAAFFILSREPLEPMAGTAPSRARVVLEGYCESSDATHMTAPREDGFMAYKAMAGALESAGIGACDIDYINLHGTGTILNDRAEARALSLLYPRIQECPLVSSTKAMTGHTLGAASALELALCYMVLTQEASAQGYYLLPHIWDGVAARDLAPLRYVSKGYTMDREPRYCMSNSLAFGGCNVSLILGREH